MDKKPQLELQQIFQLDALELINAHNRGKVIHKLKNISAAGDEVEIVFREILTRKLPNKYYIGHGHIIDNSSRSSPDFDVIVADNTNAPILFRSQKGNEYFPYESVYAVGEVKSTYYKNKKPVEEFVKNIIQTKSTLQRQQTSPNDTGIGINFSVPLTKSPYRNPLFSFIIFVDSNDFEIDDLRNFYLSTDDADLPNVICFVDKGVIVNTQIKKTEKGNENTGFVNIIPEFNPYLSSNSNHFVFHEVGKPDYRSGSNLSYLKRSHK